MTSAGRSRVYGWRVRLAHDVQAREAFTHYTPEEPDQPACDADVGADAPDVMFGTLNPQRVTCPNCRAILKEASDG